MIPADQFPPAIDDPTMGGPKNSPKFWPTLTRRRYVIPATAGIQRRLNWTPAFAGVTVCNVGYQYTDLIHESSQINAKGS
jgi:hypothetical protein